MLIGKIPMGNGDPATGVNAPLLESIENAETSFEPLFTTYRKLPAGSMAEIMGVVPAVVRGVTSVRDPSLAIVKRETSLSPEFATYKNFFEGWTDNE